MTALHPRLGPPPRKRRVTPVLLGLAAALAVLPLLTLLPNPLSPSSMLMWPLSPDARSTARLNIVGGVSGSKGMERKEIDRRGSGGISGEGLVDEDRGVKEYASMLFEAWSRMYSLGDTYPPSSVSPVPLRSPLGLSTVAPWAPHLEECNELTRRREAQETHPGPLQYPEWTCTEQRDNGVAVCGTPSPPWVRGADNDVVAGTREVQRDIWVHQHPPNCSDPSLSFLLVDWAPAGGHGVGSQLHVLSVALSIALSTRRILVPWPRTFQRANHQACQGLGRLNSSECYFFPITPTECAREAMRLGPQKAPEIWQSWREDANSSKRAVALSFTAALLGLEASAASMWGAPWEHLGMGPFEILGRTDPAYAKERLKASWWRSQTVRFFMRWPSAYLCHLTNQARHRSYGRYVAHQIAQAEVACLRMEEQQMGGLNATEADTLKRGGPEKGVPLASMGKWRFRDEPFMPRPIVSVHVRQSDKSREMRTFSLGAYMWLAERVRQLEPDARHIWLSTESQGVVEQAAEFKGWTFLHTEEPRQPRNWNDSYVYESQAGLENVAGASYVNLLVASQCDLFVGTLASNWDRVINELRLTNGRLKAHYMTLNNDEWR